MADLPRYFAKPSARGVQLPQTSPEAYGASAFHQLAELTNDLKQKQQPIDLHRLKGEYDLAMDQAKREQVEEPDTDQWEASVVSKEREIRNKVLSGTSDPLTQSVLLKEIEKDYAKNIIDVRADASKMKASQQLAYVDRQEFELSRKAALAQTKEERDTIEQEYFGLVGALSVGKYPSLRPADAEKKRQEFASKIAEQKLIITANRDPLSLDDMVEQGAFADANPAAIERAGNIAAGVINRRDRREQEANRGRAATALQVFRKDAELGQLNDAQFDAAAEFYKFDPTTVANIKRTNLGLKAPSPYAEKMIVTAMDPVNKVDPTLADIALADKNLLDLTGSGQVDKNTSEYRAATNRLRFLKDVLTPGTPGNQDKGMRSDARRRIGEIMNEYGESDTEMKGREMGKIDRTEGSGDTLKRNLDRLLSDFENQFKKGADQRQKQIQDIRNLGILKTPLK